MAVTCKKFLREQLDASKATKSINTWLHDSRAALKDALIRNTRLKPFANWGLSIENIVPGSPHLVKTLDLNVTNILKESQHWKWDDFFHSSSIFDFWVMSDCPQLKW